MTATITTWPFADPDEITLLEAARQANASHLHLVITRDGNTVLTPFLEPGMTKIAVLDKQAERAAA